MSTSGKTLLTRNKKVSYRVVRGAELVKARRAGELVTWEFNRALDEERVSRMTQDQIGRLERGDPLTLFLPVPVTVCALGGDACFLGGDACFLGDDRCINVGGVTYVMDGQHRLAVLTTLVEHARTEISAPARTAELLLCTVTCATAAELEDVFVRINSGTPVPAAYYDKKVDELLAGYCERLIGLWPLAHSEAARPQRPSFSVRRVKDAMSSQALLRNAIIDGRLTAETLVAITDRENTLERNLQGTEGAGKGIPDRCLKGAIKSEFYLGLRKEWATDIALRAIAGLDE